MFSAPLRRIVIIIALLLALMGAFGLAMPSVRASISSFLGLGASSRDNILKPTSTIELPTTTPASSTAVIPTQVIKDTPTVFPMGNVDLSTNPDIQQFSSKIGWTVLTPILLPEGYRYEGVYDDQTHPLISLSFLATRKLPGSDLNQTKSITLTEAKRNDIIPLRVSPNSTIESIFVDGLPASYVIGAWDANFMPNTSEPNGGHMEWTWRNDLQIQNVFWQVNDVSLVLITDDTQVSKAVLLMVANSVK